MMRASVPAAPAIRRCVIGDAAIARSSVSVELMALRLTMPTLRRGPASGISHIQPSGTIRILMFPVTVSSSKIAGAIPS